MQPEPTVSENHDPAKGLPAVVPLTGGFIAQLFLVPGIIVALAVCILLGFSWLAGGSRTPEQFLKDLDQSNADIRWRAAQDLAQVLLRDDRLASNPNFALSLAERLREELKTSGAAEQASAERLRQLQASGRDKQTEGAVQQERQALEPQRNYVGYLTACLGNCSIPVGVPLLNEIAVKADGAEPEALTLRRRRAVWALANLGENLKRFAKLTPQEQAMAVAELEAEAAGASERAEWARVALSRLHGQAEKPTALGVDTALARCAADTDPFLREVAAFALNFWEGSEAENARMEDVLVKLSYDDGHGATESTHVRGLEIRYNATVALARRGSGKVKGRLSVLEEMLDEDQQLKNFRTKLTDGRDIADEATARSTVTNALKAVVELRQRKPALDLAELGPAIDRLKQSTNVVLRTEAERTRIALGRTD